MKIGQLGMKIGQLGMNVYSPLFHNNFSKINFLKLIENCYPKITNSINTLRILSQCTISDQYGQLHKSLQTNLYTRTRHLRGMDNSNSNKSQVPYAFNLEGFEDSLKKY
jgi:hypothetical protein